MRSKTLRIAIVLAAVAALTFALFRLVPVNSTTAGFAYLLAILFVAARWGLVEAIVGSIASVLCLNFFFLPPIGTLTIADPQNWVALFAFLATGITASQLSAQIRRRALEAQNRQQEVEKLYSLSRSILLTAPLEAVPRRLADQASQSLGARAVALYDRATGSLYRSGPEDFPDLDDQLKQAAVQGTFFQNRATGTLITAIRLGAEPIGSLGIFGVELSDSALQSLVNLVAIGLERARAQEAASRAEAARQSEELKSTLLDAIAHEFKTPLTTIKAATTALLSSDLSRLERQRGFLAIIDEEADRLNGLISDAIQMARIEAGSVRLNREQCSIGEIVARVVENMKSALGDRDIKIAVPRDLPDISADAELIELGVRQLIDNAIKYSPAHSPVSISAALRGESLIVSVADRGPGIPEAEQPRVFEKFYRGRDSCNNQIPGAGLGLAIAREIVHAHGGEIWVESRSGGGSVFRFSLPVEGAGESE
jgi:two-component system sensor histidine kinase KdpD